MDVQLLLVPYDTARRGWRSGAGPEHLIQAGLVAHLRGEGHTVADIQVIEINSGGPAAEIATAFELMRHVAVAVRTARAAGRFPLVLGGNCNTAIGTLSGLTPSRRAVFWFDAHGDLNTPDTTPSGFLDGQGLATALGNGWKQLAATVPGFQPVEPADTFLLGARDLDPPEQALIDSTGINAVATSEIPSRLAALLAKLHLDGALAYAHLDPDVLDPAVGQGNWLRVPDGLSVTQVTEALAAIRARVPLGAVGVASYAPEYDTQQSVCRAIFAAVDAMLGGLEDS
ncbi:MAG: arginase family protein [Gemmatimonadota bacterium]